MSTASKYVCDLESMDWQVAQEFEANFRWEYDDGRDSLLKLYRKGKRQQWDADTRIDWSQDLDPENPAHCPTSRSPIFGSPVWHRLDAARNARSVRHHFQAWQLSQFLHGEQGALVCTAKIVQQVPTHRRQVLRRDAGHRRGAPRRGVLAPAAREVRARLSDHPDLKRLLDDMLSDSRWDMTYLGMQVLIEGLALAAFGTIRDQAQNPLAAAVNAYVMQDEARHVAFGRFALATTTRSSRDKERDEREEFAVEACYLMRDRFLAEEVWERLGLPVDECMEWTDHSELMRMYRTTLFTASSRRSRTSASGDRDPQGVRRHGHPRLRRRRRASDGDSGRRGCARPRFAARGDRKHRAGGVGLTEVPVPLLMTALNTSRLSCRVDFTEALDGLEVKIAPDE